MAKSISQSYIDLLKQCVTRTIFPDQRYVSGLAMEIAPFDMDERRYGKDWPTEAVTMVGVERLNAMERLIKQVVAANIPGDLVECGVWRGGCSIFMRGVLEALGDERRTVWLYDSFQGLPKPVDSSDCDLSAYSGYLGVSLDQVQANFGMFNLLDDRVKFVKGWFRDTLPVAEVNQIAVLRLDGDMYESTMDALNALYGKVAPGGYVVIDDYGAIPQCQRAVGDFRARHGIDSHIYLIDWTGAYWQKTT
jgi:hypothetical protein